MKCNLKKILLFCFLLLNNKSFAETDQENTKNKEVKSYGSFIFGYNIGLSYSSIVSNSLNDDLDKILPETELSRKVRSRYKVPSGSTLSFFLTAGHPLNDFLELQASLIFLTNLYFENYKENKDIRYKYSNYFYRDKNIDLFLGSNLLYYQKNVFELIGIYLRILNISGYSNLGLIPTFKLGIGYKFDFGLVLSANSNFSLGFFTLKNRYKNCIEEEKYFRHPKKTDILSFTSSISIPIIEISIGYDFGMLLSKYIFS